MSGSQPLRVGVIDDHAVFADALALAIDTSEDLTCVGTASNISDALSIAERADVLVVDVGLGADDGITGARQVRERNPATRVLVLTGLAPTPSLVLRVLDAGASALLMKDTSLRLVVDTIRALHEETFIANREVLRALRLGIHPSTGSTTAPPGGSLTTREHQVLELMAEGRDVQAAASLLGIKVNTCRGYVKSLLAKLGAHSQLEALAIARADGLLDQTS